MPARTLHMLIQSLLLLFLWLSPIRALTLPTPSRPSPPIRHTSLHALRAPPPQTVSAEATNPSAGHNLKFKEYSIWIKDKSKHVWESHKERMAREAAIRDYTSPYMTKFSDKEDGWWAAFDFGRMWRHFLWETIPSMWTGPELPQ